VRISENEYIAKDTDDKITFSPDSHEGGGDQNQEIVENDFQNSVKNPYCESLSFVGMKVKYFKDEKVIGEIISEPKRISSNFTVQVKWTKPRIVKGIGKLSVETCFITVLTHETINFMAWREGQLNG